MYYTLFHFSCIIDTVLMYFNEWYVEMITALSQIIHTIHFNYNIMYLL